ncbi:calumenin-like [Oppia nitens]|uniref:calumenin-like n=1 Tax=Oppia nitens TaxID=1686743 RepID=UPI0023DC67D6|nr:calumenin-like [Oppia nitens]
MSHILSEFLVNILVLSLVFGLAIPNSDDKTHKQKQDEHLHESSDGNHNTDYDHKAFLGEDADEFDQLSPEESKERLAKIVDKIDKNSDGLVTTDELKEWIHYTQNKYIIDDVDRQWKSHTGDDDSMTQLLWIDYKNRTFGFLEDMTVNSVSDVNTYKEMLKRDERRWKLADRNQDNSLSKSEFLDFLHPEEAQHMRDVVVDETLEDIDKDGDGRISVDEYITDMYAPDASADQVPDWVIREKQQFKDIRDKNKDGFMDRDEIREWVLPPDYDHSEAEAKHLIAESDTNKDGKLTKDEILNSYDVFVGSQATDFGEALLRHEEF